MTDAQKEDFFVTDLDASGGSESPIQTPMETRPEKVTSLGRDAWLEMRRKPSFWISAALIVLFMLMAIFPLPPVDPERRLNPGILGEA